MNRKNRTLHLLLIVALLLAPMTSMAAGSSMAPMESPAQGASQQEPVSHQPHAEPHPPQAMETASPDHCSGMAAMDDCCASCIGCALPASLLAEPETSVAPPQLGSLDPPRPFLESERQPPRPFFS
ncbi:MAG: hypothetical protein R3296_09370 [Oleiphilaceae bacterium]|nr:hypothetical protein [Oleiphilaceae bacterium]